MSIKKWKGNRYRLDLKIRKDGEVFRLTKVVDSVKEAKQLEAEFRFKIDNELTVSKLTPFNICLLYTSPSPRDYAASRMPSSA